MNTFSTGYTWKIAVDLKSETNPIKVDDLDVVKFVAVTTVKQETASTSSITASFAEPGDMHAVGRIICVIPDTVTANISCVPHRLEIGIVVNGELTGPYYSDIFEVKKGFVQ